MIMTTIQLQAQVQEPDLPTALFLAAICGQTHVQFSNKETGFFILPDEYKLIGAITTSDIGIDNDRFGFIIVSKRCSRLAFRGTSTSLDWVYDLRHNKPNFHQ